MTCKDLKLFNIAQIEEIKKYKWIRSEKANYDIGENQAALEWIELYGNAFREHWCKVFLSSKNSANNTSE